MKKWFKDNTLATQPLSRESASEIYKIPKDKIEEIIKDELFVVLRTIFTSTQSVQIAFNTKQYIQNNGYSVFGFDLCDNLLWFKSFQSHTVVPPVWDRLFGGMDYVDWLAIQYYIRLHIPDAMLDINYETGEIGDFSFYFVKEPDAYQKLQSGEGYHPICVFASAKPELVQHAKEFCEREFGGTNVQQIPF